MPKPWFTIQAQADTGQIEVSIRGLIGEYGESDRSFIDRVSALADGAHTIHLTINSRGGEVDHALAIFNWLRSHPARVRVKIDGVAASAASIIAMAGDEIIMPANALMMVHAPWTFAVGNAGELRRAADDLEKFEAALIATYMARTGKTEDEIKALLAVDTWMTAKEAVEHGFADTIEPIERPMAMAMAEAAGIPSEVLARVEALSAIQSDADLEGQVKTLCMAAARPTLVSAMMPLAKAAGVDAVREVLAALEQPSGIHSAHAATAAASTAQDQSVSTASAIARLGLRAINPHIHS